MPSLHLWLKLLTLVCLVSCQQIKTPQYFVGVSQCSNDEWRKRMNAELEQEAVFYKGLHLEIRSAHDDNRKQIEDIEFFIRHKADAIIVSPNEADAITPIIEKAYKAGIAVIIFDRKIDSNKYTAYIGANNFEIGYNAGVYVASRLGGRGNIIEIEGLSRSTPAEERHKGFIQALAKEPHIRILTSAPADWFRNKAQQRMDSLLHVYPNIDLVFAQNDRMAVGAYQAALKHKREKDILFVGIDALPGEEYGIDQVQKGILDVSFIYPTGGDKALQLAMKILQKQPYQRENILQSALVDRTNAHIMKMQNTHIEEQNQRINYLKEQVDKYLAEYSSQRLILSACIVIITLLTVIFVLVTRAYWTKTRTNATLKEQKEMLEKQKLQLEKQRDELAEQRDQLLQLSQQLEQATQAKLVFFTNVSHDFRTPLTLIADPVNQLLQDSRLDEQQRNWLQLIQKNTQILLRLVNQILDFRKYENGKMELNLSRTDAQQSCKDWSESFRSIALKKHIHFSLSVDHPEQDYHIIVDAEKLERIYFNLLSNAFKFTPENGCIQVSIAQRKEDTHTVFQLTVKDTGIGIPEEHIKHIFDRFYKADIHHSGSGIGLALVKAFVDLHQGHIQIESEPGKGTTFTIELPYKWEEQGISELPTTRENDPTLIPSTHLMNDIPLLNNEVKEQEEQEASQPCILLIDDNADIRSYMRSILKDQYRILEAADGKEGVQTAIRYIPDLIICDVMMPVMDGLECCAHLKEAVNTSHIPVILLTACALDEQRIEGFECGADSYISKPFNTQVLLARIKNLIDNRKRIRQFFGDSSSAAKETVSNTDKGFAERLRELIEDHIGNAETTVEELGEKMGLSRVQLYRKVKALTNYSPNELLRMARLRKAASLLNSTEKTVSEIAYEVGFTSPSYFTKCYKEFFGKNPTNTAIRKK